MIRTQIKTPADILDAVQVQLSQNKTRALMVKNFKREITPVSEWIIGVLSTEPTAKKKQGLWESARQRKAYFASNGFGKGIPYKRDHALANAWKTTFKLVSQRAAEWGLLNAEPFAQYVQGPRAQVFHVDRWSQVKTYEVELGQRVENATINAWFETCETTAMTKGKR